MNTDEAYLGDEDGDGYEIELEDFDIGDFDLDEWVSDPYQPLDPEYYGASSTEARALQRGYHGSAQDVRRAGGPWTGDVILPPSELPEGVKKVHSESPKYFVNYMSPNAAQKASGTVSNSSTPNTPEEREDAAQREAWMWSSVASTKHRPDLMSDEEKANLTPGAGRPRVHKGYVEQISRPVGMDFNIVSESEAGSWLQRDLALPMAGENFVVTDTDWIPPSDTGKAVQGTLPGINWNQHGAPNVGNPEDVTHGLTPMDKTFRELRQSDKVRADNRAAKLAETTIQQRRGTRARQKANRAMRGGQMQLPGFEA